MLFWHLPSKQGTYHDNFGIMSGRTDFTNVKSVLITNILFKMKDRHSKSASYDSDEDLDLVRDTITVEHESGFNRYYEALEILGTGLASTVRKCTEKSSGKMYAVKIVDISTEKQSAYEATRLREETLSEIEILKRCSDHQSIIEMHDFFETPTFLFAVFELAPMGELFDLLNKSVRLSEKKVRNIMTQLFDGVAYLHSLNIVHRDLKLENILCITESRVVISDFGFAKQLKKGELLRDLFGTPGYLAPETLKCQMYEDHPGYSLEVDNWALGVIMYTMLAGHAPFYHRKQLIMMRMIQEGKFEFLKDQWENVSVHAKDLISNLLVVDVEKRLTAEKALEHPFMTFEGTLKRRKSLRYGVVEEIIPPKKPKNLRQLFRVAILAAKFLHRIQNGSLFKTSYTKEELRKRPYRSKAIWLEAEAATFAIYGHWVNRGFFYSRDMLFANKPKPKMVRV
uniref:phosphorylase kinase n=1 Tax=Strongyloides venezuelensis TaxID=75913 RepID=A0A0K0G4B9_STRVS